MEDSRFNYRKNPGSAIYSYKKTSGDSHIAGIFPYI